MFSSKKIVVTIGNNGALVALHGKDNIINHFFLEEFNDKSKEELKTFFAKHRSASVCVLLDTFDQSYKKKIYPAVTKADLSRLMLRDMHSDPDKESFKNYLVLNSKKTSRTENWECLYISSSRSQTINDWIEFLLDLPNHLVGIYMLPIESFHLFKLLKKLIKISDKKNDIYCLIMQNKISGIRQVVFSDSGIVFTRVVNYDFTQKDFLQKFETDIYGTFEYLKRMFPDLTPSDLDIINIFPEEVLGVIKNSTNLELKYTNITPAQAALEAGCTKDVLDSQFCDLLISKVISQEKKILRFAIPKINLLGRLFITLKFSYYLNLIFSGLIAISLLYMVFSQNHIRNLIKVAETEKLAAQNELQRVRTAAFDGETLTDGGKAIDIETVMDFGRMETTLGLYGSRFIDLYLKLKFLKDYKVKLSNFYYSIENFNSKFPEGDIKYKIQFTGKIFNKSGDIEDLFRDFDLLVSAVKKNFGDNSQVKYTELPRNIDFNQKYYDFNIDFTVITN